MVEPVGGHATQEGSERFAEAARVRGVDPKHFRRFGALTLTSLGIGTYLGGTDTETDRLVEDSICRSVSSGAINVIDTAINYRLQKAERCVGRALKRLIQGGVATRESCFLCTKNGYLTSDGDSSVDFWEYVHRELIRPGRLKPDDIAGEAHAMSVPFLKDQFERSLGNLGVQTIDLVYLHNAPESWLNEIGIRRFLEKLEPAFAYYEEERGRGRLAYYGLATWTAFRVPRDDPGHLNLDDVVEVAKNVGGSGHGFRFIQMPFNIAMSEGLLLKNQRIADEPLTPFEAAARLGVGVFTSAPLAQGRLLTHSRLPPVGGSPAVALLQFARSAHRALLAPLVGQKRREHVEENIRLASMPPLDEGEFDSVFSPLLKGGPRQDEA